MTYNKAFALLYSRGPFVAIGPGVIWNISNIDEYTLAKMGISLSGQGAAGYPETPQSQHGLSASHGLPCWHVDDRV